MSIEIDIEEPIYTVSGALVITVPRKVMEKQEDGTDKLVVKPIEVGVRVLDILVIALTKQKEKQVEVSDLEMNIRLLSRLRKLTEKDSKRKKFKLESKEEREFLIDAVIKADVQGTLGIKADDSGIDNICRGQIVYTINNGGKFLS